MSIMKPGRLMKTGIKIGLLALTLCAQTACVSLLPEKAPPATRYMIPPVTFATDSDGPVSWSLAVADPTASRAFDTTKIALSRSPGQIEYYAKAEWADRSTEMVRLALVRSFENTGRILGIGDIATMPGADYVLRTDLRSFQVRYDGASNPVVETAVFAKLTNRRGKVMASRLFSENQTVSRDSVSEVGQAFNAATSTAIRDIIIWSFEEVDERQKTAKAE